MGLLSLFVIALSVISTGQTPELSGRLKTMQAEISRNFDALQKEQIPPYYISYSIDEVRSQSVAGSFGAIIAQNEYYVSQDCCSSWKEL